MTVNGMRMHRGKTRFAIGVLVLTAAAVAVSVVMRRDRDPFAQLAKAIDATPYRNIEPRLSAGFAFRPYRAGGNAQLNAAFFQAMRSAGNNAHAQAIAHLLRGNVGGAIARLEEIPPLHGTNKAAAIQRAVDGEVLVDYASALYERAVRESRPLDFPTAFAAANRASALLPNRPEPRQVRALILERLNLREDAQEAWLDYLRSEHDPAWAAEGREHLTRVTKAARTHVELQEMRVRAEEKLLGDWGVGIEAGSSLAEAKRIGRSLERAGGDRTVARCVDLIEDAASRKQDDRRKALADGHAAYQRARIAFAKARDETARSLMSEAARLLDRAGSPLSYRAHIYSATIDSYFGRNEKALSILQTVLDGIGEHSNEYLVAMGQAHWTRGLIQFAMGMPYQAVRSYDTAVAYFQRAGETSNFSGVEAVLAETYRYLGDPDNAWSHQVRALQALGVGATYTRRQIATTAAAFAVIDLGYLDLAELLTRRLATNASAKRDPIFGAQAAVISAQIQNARKQPREAMKAIADAEHLLGSIPPTSSVGRLIADVAILRAQATMADNAEQAIASLQSGLGRLQSLEHSSRLPRVYLLLGQSCLRRGDRAAAERAFFTGIEVLEGQRNQIASDIQRSTFTDTGRALYDSAIRLLVDRGDTDRAREMVRRARSMASPAFGARANRLFVARGDALIEYYLLPDALLIWFLSGDDAKFVEQRVTLPALTIAMNRASAAISEGSDAATARVEAARAYDVLLRPVAALLRKGQSLFIAPDGVLHRVPFGALVDSTGTAFIENHAVTILLGSEPTPADARYRSILVVAPPPLAGFEPLTNTVREASRAAAAFPKALLLDGPAATPQRLLTDADRYDIVHFVGHALWNERDPELAALQLSPDAGARDGAMRAFEVSSHRFQQTRLIVLAACDTARGRVAGPGLLSFTRTFVAAGVPRVVGSLWPAGDEASAHLFTDFYDALKNGQQPAEALRDAQRKAIVSGLTARDWAMFQLYAGGV